MGRPPASPAASLGALLRPQWRPPSDLARLHDPASAAELLLGVPRQALGAHQDELLEQLGGALLRRVVEGPGAGAAGPLVSAEVSSLTEASALSPAPQAWLAEALLGRLSAQTYGLSLSLQDLDTLHHGSDLERQAPARPRAPWRWAQVPGLSAEDPERAEQVKADSFDELRRGHLRELLRGAVMLGSAGLVSALSAGELEDPTGLLGWVRAGCPRCAGTTLSTPLGLARAVTQDDMRNLKEMGLYRGKAASVSVNFWAVMHHRRLPRIETLWAEDLHPWGTCRCARCGLDGLLSTFVVPADPPYH